MKSQIVQSARELALQAHANQTRRDGKPYFSHLEAVANYVELEWFNLIPQSAQEVWNPLKEHIIAAAWAHDIKEDQGFDNQQLRKAGLSELTVGIIDIVTHRNNEDYFEYIMRIHDSGPFRVGAVAVKLADLAHNLENNTNKKQVEKYKFARYILSIFNN